MNCLKCGGKTGVLDSRPSLSKQEVIRKRQCKKCGDVFKTFEWVDDSEDLEEEYREVHRRLQFEHLMRVAERRCDT